MSIAPITAYPMPGEGDLPANRVSWTAESSRVALLIHDMQNYFLAPFPPGRSPATELVGNIEAIRDLCVRRGIPVAYSAQPGDMTPTQRGLLLDFWGEGMSAAPVDRDIVGRLRPGETDQVFTKWRYSAFHRSPLLSFVRDHGRDQLIVCGVYAGVGCLMTACDAFTHDIQPFLVADAVADFSEQGHRTALAYAASNCAVTLTTARLLADLRAT